MSDQPKQPIALEQRETSGDARMQSPSAGRNRDVIRDVFLDLMPLAGTILEIASGTGEHAVHILKSAPDLTWIPSDLDNASRASVAAWAVHEKLEQRLLPPRIIDASSENWGDIGQVQGMMSCNMIHIAPWAAGRGLIAGAGRHLAKGGRLFLYGPFSRNGEHTASSNADFDESLKSRNPDWGVRDLESDVLPEVKKARLEFIEARPMPANNFAVVFEKL